MAVKARKTASNIFVWIILGLLFVALAGFGIGSFTGGASRVGSVGEEEITAEDYARALQNELRAQIAQTQRPLTLRDLMNQGTDQAILRALVARAALADEAREMGLSVGDATVARQITQIPGLTGPDGRFDRDAYEFELRQNGLTVAEFEEDIRADTARDLLQLAIVGGVVPNPVIADTLTAYQSETRDIALLTLTEADLPEALPEPAPEDLSAYYEDNGQRFTRPEAKRITYAWVRPAMLMDEVEIDEEALRALYEDRRELYVQPERRLLERLVYLDLAAAQAAADAIAAGETDFDTLVADRGLSLEDVDLGEVAAEDLAPEAAAVIFADDESEIIGPVESALGPAIFRVNAVLEASEVPFEDAREELSAELAADAARRLVADLRDEVDDLLAAGATLEELTSDTVLRLATLDYTAASEDPIAGYDAFRDAADAVQDGDFPEVLDLSDGGIFALRLDAVVPPTLPPLAEIEAEVAEAWAATELRAALATRAETVMAELATGAALEDFGTVTLEAQVRRQDRVPGAPPTLVAQVFQLQEPGATAMVPGAEQAVIARLEAINPGARDAEDTGALLGFLEQAVAQSLAQDLFEAYGLALEAEKGIRLDQAVINAVHAQFQ